MAPACDDGQPFDAEVLAPDFLRQRQHDIEGDVQRAGGEFALDVAALGPDDVDIDARRSLGDVAHETREHGRLERIAHADDKALGGSRQDRTGLPC